MRALTAYVPRRHDDTPCLETSPVRIAFLDEAGRSAGEPIITVAGVIAHGDRDYRRLEEALRSLAAKEIPPQDRNGFVFRAADVFHGSGYFDRRKWQQPARFNILRRLASLPDEHSLPVVFGHVVKTDYRKEPSVVSHLESQPERERSADLLKIEHMTAFTRAVICIERRIRHLPEDEICMVVAEDTDQVKPTIKAAYAFLRDPNQIVQADWPEIDGLPLRRVVDTPHFAAKRESPLLQIADVCAFLITRRLRRQESSQPFFELIAPRLAWDCSDFGERIGNETLGGGAQN
jgi:hypothetical protein